MSIAIAGVIMQIQTAETTQALTHAKQSSQPGTDQIIIYLDRQCYTSSICHLVP